MIPIVMFILFVIFVVMLFAFLTGWAFAILNAAIIAAVFGVGAYVVARQVHPEKNVNATAIGLGTAAVFFMGHFALSWLGAI